MDSPRTDERANAALAVKLDVGLTRDIDARPTTVISADGTALAADVLGVGPPLILLHATEVIRFLAA